MSDVQINVDIANTRGVTITGNTMWKGYAYNLRVHNCQSVVVSGNVFDRNPRYHHGDGKIARQGLIFTDSDGCTINANQILGAAADPAAVVIRNCRRFNITDCTILDSAPCALLLEGVLNSRVSGCLIRNDRPRAAGVLSLKVRGGSGNMIVNNLLGDPHSIPPRSAHAAGNHDGKKRIQKENQ